MTPVLHLDRFGVAFGEKVVLNDVTFDVPAAGVTVLVGPTYSGKSTLLRTIAGHNATQPALRTWGKARYQGHPLGEGDHPEMVMQNMRLLTSTVRENLVSVLPNRWEMTVLDQKKWIEQLFAELGLDRFTASIESSVVGLPLSDQRCIALARAFAKDAALTCFDEPTNGLSEEEAAPLLRLIRRLGDQRAVLWVTHHQAQARTISDQLVLLAGGTIWEKGDAKEFFRSPTTDVGRSYAATGGCSVPSPMAKKADLQEGTPAPKPIPRAAQRALRDYRGPTDFYWLYEGQLGGAPRPGVTSDLAHDLDRLERIGVTVLITLEENRCVDQVALTERNIRNLFFPIDDMGAPDLERAAKYCRQIEELIEAGEVVVVHCRAGMGRTGTMLAAQLIWRGASALDALEKARQINPRWIQSSQQVDFLNEFAKTVASRRVEGAVVA